MMAPAERDNRIGNREAALDSILTQDRPPHLVLVVETSLDASLDAKRVQDITQRVLGPQNPGEDAARPTILRVTTTGAQRFGSAVDEALTQVPAALDCRWLWLLHDDMVAHHDALDHLLEAGEASRTIGVVGPKQVRYGQPEQLLELGVDATANARRVFVIEPDEIDQGQYDQREEVLAVGTAGMLVRTQVWRQVEGLDPALGAFGGGLEFGRRTWRSGNRVVVAPSAVVEHAQASYRHDTQGRSSFSVRRAAQLYNWALALPEWRLWLLFIWLPFLSLGRAFARLFSRHPGLAFSEVGAYFRFLHLLPALWRGRRRLRRVSRVPRSALTPLESKGSQISRAKRANRRINARGSESEMVLDLAAVAALRRHRLQATASFIALVVAAIIVSIFVWFPYRTGIQGGAWGGLPTQWTTLMAQAWSGWQLSGDGLPGPASSVLLPLSLVSAPFALVGISPLTFANLLLYAAVPLAAMEGWALASSYTRSTAVRVAAGALWATSGTVLLTLMRGDLASLILILALPPVVIGLTRGLRPPPTLLARGVGSVAAVPIRNTVAWLGVAGLASAAVVCAAPIMVVILPVAAAMLGGDRRSWEGTAALEGLTPPPASTRVASVFAVSIPGLALILPSLVKQITVGSVHQFWVWLTAPELGAISPWAGAAVPAALPLSPWTTPLAEAAIQGLLQPWLLVAVAASAVVLGVWALTCAVGSTVSGRPAASLGAFVFGAALLGLALLQAFLLPGAGSVSAAFFAGMSAAFVVAVSAAYPDTTLTVSTLRETSNSRIRWSRGLPSAVGIAVSALAAVAALVLGPIGFLSARAAAPAADSPALSPLLEDEAAGTPDLDGGATFPPLRATAFIAPAPATSVPVIAQQAQTGPRAARMLALRLTSGTVEAYLLRGADLQQADLRVVPLASLDQSVAVEAARDHLLATTALLTAQPSPTVAQALADHAIDVVMVSSQSEDFLSLQNVLDATIGLERIGNVEGSVLWRVRPSDFAPARVTIYADDPVSTDSGSTDSGPLGSAPIDSVPSGSVKVDTEIEVQNGGILVLAETADPAWHATLDGEDLTATTSPTDDWRQAFELPAGAGHLEVTYDPGYRWWWWVGAGLALSVIALMAVPRRVGFRKLLPVGEEAAGDFADTGSTPAHSADDDFSDADGADTDVLDDPDDAQSPLRGEDDE